MDNIKKVFIIAENNLLISSWKDAIPDAIILPPDDVVSILNPSIIIIVATTNNWLSIVKNYSSQEIPTLVLSRHGDVEELNTAMIAGARGYMNLFSTPEILKLAIDSIISGAFWIPPKFLENLLRISNASLHEKESNKAFELLTHRENQVADLVIQGLSNKKIAAELGICERTIKLHVSSILHKLNIADRIQLILMKKGHF